MDSMLLLARWTRWLLGVSTLGIAALGAQAAPQPGDWLYSVRPGDTLIDLANLYLEKPSAWGKLQEINKVADPKRLRPGSRLRIPVAMLKREATVAEVVHVQGDGQSLAGAVATRLVAGMQLRVGDTIKTAAGSTLTLRFVDGSRLLVAENSKLTLLSLLRYGKTEMVDTRVQLDEGGVETQVAPQKGSAAKYEVKAPTLHLGVRGTDFRVRVDGSDGATRSEVLEGRVAATGERGKEVLVNAGFGTLARAGESPRAPKALLAAPDLGPASLQLDRVPLRFQWPAVTGAKSYRAQVFADRKFDSMLLDGVFTGPSAKWGDLPDGKYVLRVRAVDADGLEGVNTERDFTLKARPEPPFISAPADGSKSYGDKAVLRWTQSTVAKSYRIQVSGTADFAALLAEERSLAATEYSVTLAPGAYFWRIASIAADGDQGPFSDTYTFTQRLIPASPETEPPQLGDKELAFGWKAGAGGQKYQFQFASDSEFKNLLLDTVTPDTRITVPRPGPGAYFMRVKTIDEDGFAGPFGQAQRIEIPAPKPWWLLVIPLLLIHW